MSENYYDQQILSGRNEISPASKRGARKLKKTKTDIFASSSTFQGERVTLMQRPYLISFGIIDFDHRFFIWCMNKYSKRSNQILFFPFLHDNIRILPISICQISSKLLSYLSIVLCFRYFICKKKKTPCYNQVIRHVLKEITWTVKILEYVKMFAILEAYLYC